MKKIKLWTGMILMCLALAVVLPGEAKAEEVTASGECGDNLTWTLTADGTLTISGEGAMTNYSYSQAAPWGAYWESITGVVLGDSVTSIGSMRSITAPR